jgi:UDP-N-acetylglucosamine--N-acetylmuramyl-(pentapeptide) pyrophosphoryl-undecaprenol N-acetylglucosamine transferase
MRNETEATYVIAAGGTGGHIFPGIALARAVKASCPGARVVFVGTRRGLESRLVPEAGFALETVRASGFAGKGPAARLASLLRLPLGILEARRLLRRLAPRAVAGVGGYVSVPVVLAARSLSIPTLIHESNALPGVANRLLSRVATRCAVGLEAARDRLGRPSTVTGNPVRPEFFAVPALDPAASPRRVLVFGGSQGSAALNRAMLEAVPRLSRAGLEVVHQTGQRWLDQVRGALADPPPGWRLEAFLPRLYEQMSWADLVVCRAGSMTLSELSAAGRPAVLVPLPSSTHGHQRENALAFARAGAAVVLEERDLSGQSLADAVQRLLADAPGLARMGRQARALAHPDAAARLAQLLFEIEREAA